jgi:lipopolysaccharide/colanic/teichoic acid biosynthesis glycosyltransferase
MKTESGNPRNSIASRSILRTRAAAGAPRLFMSRTLHIGSLALALPVWLLLMAGVALLIKIVSRGPVFVVQPPNGRRHPRFRCLRFRTVRTNAGTPPTQTSFRRIATPHVPTIQPDANGRSRLIPCGAFLRASGLDELPQVINVFLDGLKPARAEVPGLANASSSVPSRNSSVTRQDEWGCRGSKTRNRSRSTW